MTTGDLDEDLRAAIDGELRLLQAETRQNPAEVEWLLDPEFVEVGASGRVFSRPALVAALASETGQPGAVAAALDLRATRVAPGVVLLTYTSEDDERRCRRSSLWRRTDARWQLLFHQGTLVPTASAQ